MIARKLPDGSTVRLAVGLAAPGEFARGQHVGIGCLWLQHDNGPWIAFDRHRSQHQAWQWVQVCDTWEEVCDALDIPEGQLRPKSRGGNRR